MLECEAQFGQGFDSPHLHQPYLLSCAPSTPYSGFFLLWLELECYENIRDPEGTYSLKTDSSKKALTEL